MRAGHTSVVDAAGAIYVIGGYGGYPLIFQDVWASTDGGDDWTRAGDGLGALGGYSGVAGVLKGTKGVLSGTALYSGVY
jgi:hypothetical protein